MGRGRPRGQGRPGHVLVSGRGSPAPRRTPASDVLHCPTMRAPLRSKIPLVVTIHDVAVLRHPEAFNGWTRRYSARTLPRVVRAANAIVVGSAFSRDELVELLRRADESKVRVIPYGVGPPFTPEGPAADGRLRARRLDARAEEELRPPRRGLPALRARRARAARRRRRGLGRRRASTATGCGGWKVSTTRSSRACTAAPWRSSTSRSTRASGCRCSRRWPAGLRSSRPPAGRTTSSRRASPSRSTRSTSTRSRRASSGRSPPARSRSACAGRPTSPGSAPCRSHVDLYKELAG